MEPNQEIVLTKAQLDEVVAKASKAAVDKALSDATPDLLAGRGKALDIRVGKDHAERQKQSECVRDYFAAMHDKSFGAFEKLQKDYPQWIPQDLQKSFMEKANFSSGSTVGGAGMPTFLHAEVTQAYERFGYAAALCRTFNHEMMTEYLPAMDSLTGGMIGEAGAGSEIDITGKLTKATATVKNAEASVIGSKTWALYANPQILTAVIDALGMARAQVVDMQWLTGSGSGNNHTGLIATSGVLSTSLAATKLRSDVSWIDLVTLQNTPNLYTSMNGIIVIGQTAWSYVVKEKTTTGAPIQDLLKPMEYQGKLGYGVLQNNAWVSANGFKVVVVPDSLFPSSAATNTFAAFGNWSEFAYIGNGKMDGIEVYKEAMNSTILSGTQVGYKLLFDFSLAFPAPAAFALLKAGAAS
jgi:HK97 family phage major capsid protein